MAQNPGSPPPNNGQQYPPQGYPQQPPYVYGQQPPAGYGYPPSPPPKSHNVRNIVLAVVGVIVLSAVISSIAGGGKKDVSGGASSSNQTSVPATSGPTSEAKKDGSAGGSSSNQTSVPAASGPTGEAKDVNLGAITTDTIVDWAKVAVTVTNNSSKSSNYVIQLALQSADGKTQVDTATVIVNNLEPQQTTNQDGQFFKVAPQGAIVKVVSVDRWAAS